jgi:hypothetical protein
MHILNENAPARSGNSGEGNESHVGAGLNAEPIDLVALSPQEARLWFEGFQWGRIEGRAVGYKAGYAACDNEISTLQHEAARIVHYLAKVPPRDREADGQAAQRRESHWNRKGLG